MAERIDILDERDPLGVPLLGSLLIHVAVIAFLFLGWYWMQHSRRTLGDTNAAGGPSYAVSPVRNIPIPPKEAPPNPVAADTESTVRTAPAQQNTEKRQPPPDKNAIEIPDKLKKQAERPLHQEKYMQQAPQNQVYSRTRQAVSNPMYGGPTGAGRVGIGPNTLLGDNRLGWYAELIRQRIAQNWLTNGLDVHSQTAPAIVSFFIMRDGSVRNVQIVESSGSPTIDNTALRAVYNSNPLPALPPQVSGSSISAQFTFNLR